MADYRKLFFLILALGIAVRIFVAIALPDFVLTDTVYHLSISKFIAQNGFLPFQNAVLGVASPPPALFHYFIASASLLSGLQITVSTATIFALFTSIVQLLLAFILLRNLFPKNWPIGLAFFTIMPLLTKFAGINYVETLASIFVMLAFYLFVRFKETGNNKFLAISIFPLAAMVSTAVVTIVLLAGFLFFFCRAALKNGKRKEAIALFLLAAILLSSTWYAMDFFRTGSPISAYPDDSSKLLNWVNTLPVLLKFNQSFWEFPSIAALSRPELSSLLPVIGTLSPETWFWLLSAITMPLLLLLAFWVFRDAIQRKHPHSLLLLALFALAMLPVIVRTRTGFVYARLFIPAMPLLAISFAYGFEALSEKWKPALSALIAIVAIYSFANVSFTALYYGNSFNKDLPLYNEIAKLPPGSKIIMSGNNSRIAEWFAKIDTLGPEGAFEMPRGTDAAPIVSKLSGGEIYAKLKELSISHFAVVCADDPWNRTTIEQLESEGRLQKIFEKDCAALFEVK